MAGTSQAAIEWFAPAPMGRSVMSCNWSPPGARVRESCCRSGLPRFAASRSHANAPGTSEAQGCPRPRSATVGLGSERAGEGNRTLIFGLAALFAHVSARRRTTRVAERRGRSPRAAQPPVTGVRRSARSTDPRRSTAPGCALASPLRPPRRGRCSLDHLMRADSNPPALGEIATSLLPRRSPETAGPASCAGSVSSGRPELNRGPHLTRRWAPTPFRHTFVV